MTTQARDAGRCACGAWAMPPLPICKACYAKEQEKQRNRGRNPVVTGNTPQGKRWRLMPR